MLRRATAVVIAVAAATGCQQLFNVSDGNHGDGGSGSDGPIGPAVTGTYGFTDVVNSATHKPTASDGMYSGLTASVMLDDGTMPPVTSIAGTFQFNVEHLGQRYVVSLSVDGKTERFDSTAAQLTLVDHLYGRLDRAAVQAGTELDFTAQNKVSATAFPTVYTTGLWAQTTLPQFSTVTSFMLPWANMTSLSGPVGLLDDTKNDEMFIGLVDSVGAYYALDGVVTEDLDMTGGGKFVVQATINPLLLQSCMTVSAARADELTRIQSAGFGSGSALHALWHINAQPTTAYGAGAGLQIAYEFGTNNTDDTIAYAIPFPGHLPVLGMTVYADRPITYGSDAPILGANASEHYVLPDASCGNPSIVPTEVALPTQATLDGVALDTDNLAFVVDRSKPQLLAWTNTPGKADASRVDLMSLGDDGAGHTILAPVAIYYSSTNSVLIDPASLESNVIYAIRITTLSGYPNAASGDFATVQFPFEDAYMFPGTFVAR